MGDFKNKEDNLLAFEIVLSKVQSYISQNFSDSLNSVVRKNSIQDKAYVASKIEQYIQDNNIKCRSFYEKDKILTNEELVKDIQNEMLGFSILDELLSASNIEEININSYKDVFVLYEGSKGKVRYNKHFLSAEHSVNIIRKLLDRSGIIVNDSQPIVTGFLNNNIRITVYMPPCIDKELGVGASIRIINPKHLTLEDFVKFGEGTTEMLTFLCMVFRYGLSLCITGATGSGKTTLMSLIMENIKNENRLITAEERVREYNLIKRDDNGYMTNDVVHLVTRPSEEEKSNVTMKKLLFTILTSDPDHISISEMKGDESLMAISAGNTGHSVITTIHADSCLGTYYRMLMLSKEMYNIQDDLILSMACSAFRIVCFVKKCYDGKRRILEISECLGLNENKEPIMNTLYKFDYKSNKEIDGKRVVEGDFVKVNNPSEFIKDKFIMNGAKLEEYDYFFNGNK